METRMEYASFVQKHITSLQNSLNYSLRNAAVISILPTKPINPREQQFATPIATTTILLPFGFTTLELTKYPAALASFLNISFVQSIYLLHIASPIVLKPSGHSITWALNYFQLALPCSCVLVFPEETHHIGVYWISFVWTESTYLWGT